MKIESDFLPSPKLLGIFIVIFFVLSSFLLFFTKFAPFMDEAIYFEMTTRLMRGEGLSTSLFRDFIPGVDQLAHWYPPIYFFSLVPFFKIFGASIFTMRMFSLLASLLVLALVFLISRKISKWRWAGIVTILILSLDHYFQTAALIGRMEILTIAFGVTAIFFHLRFLEQKQQVFNLLSGFFISLSCLTHPTGIIFAIPIGLNILFLKESIKAKIANFLILIFLPLLGFSLWLLSVFPDWGNFVLQNQLQMHRKEFSDIYVWSLLKFSPEQRWILLGYFFSSAVFVFRVLASKSLSSKKIRLLFFLVITSTSLAILLKEMWYLVYIPVFGSMAMADNIFWLWKKKPLLALMSLTILLLPNSLMYFKAVEESTLNRFQYKSFSKKIADSLPMNSNVLLSSIPDPYFYLIENRPDLNLRETPNSPPREPIDKSVYETILAETDYVVLSIAANIHLYEYYTENTESVEIISSDNGGYSLQVVKLLPHEKRKEFSPKNAKFWNYPKEN